MTARGRTRTVLRAASAGLGLLLALVLTGCLAIPDSGPVESVAIEPGDDPDALLLVPDGPAEGASPEEIVEGFLLAGQGPQGSYSVAREFLADAFRAEWSPTGGVLITSSSLAASATDGATVEVPVVLSAEVDAAGRYSETVAGERRDLEFRVAKQADGEYRIVEAPDGTVLPPSAFELIFEPYALYYYDPDFAYLVPELRWFLDTATVASRIVQQLVAGDSALLRDGVLVSAFPNGAATDGTVTVEAGRAIVPLDSSIAAQSSTAQWRMMQQLEASLVALPDVREVGITIAGLSVSIADLGPTPDRFLSVSSQLVGERDGEFGELGASQVRRIEGIGDAVDALDARAVVLGRDGDTAAVLGADGVSVIRRGEASLIDGRRDLVAPALDPHGDLWSVPAAAPGRLLVVARSGGSTAVPLELTGRITALRVSRDGTRLAVALESPDGPHLLIYGVTRDRALVPTGLVDPVEVPLEAEHVRDAVWVDGATLAALVTTSQGVRVQSVVLGGSVTDLGGVDGGVQLTAGASLDSLRVLTRSGEVLRPTSEIGWSSTGTHASVLAVLG